MKFEGNRQITDKNKRSHIVTLNETNMTPMQYAECFYPNMLLEALFIGCYYGNL